MRLQGVLFERRGQFGVRIDAEFDEPWTEAGAAAAWPGGAVATKDAQQLWGAVKYRPGTTRGLAGVECVYAAVLDADCMDVGALDDLLAWLRARGQAAIAYTSWSHGSPDKYHKDSDTHGPFDCFRLVLPYSRPVLPVEHEVLVPALFGFELPKHAPHYAAQVRGKWMERANGTTVAARPRGWDPASARPAQAYFAPSPTASLDVLPGAPLDVTAILARPATAKPNRVRPGRQYVPPTAAALGALSDIGKALARQGAWLSEPSLDGWHRTACPSCAPGGVQRSPSFRVRANGERIEVSCFAGCRRADIMRVLGLDADGRFKAPSELREELEAQLDRQEVGECIPVAQAVDKLVADIRAGVEANRPTVIKYPAGTGKAQPHSEPVLLERGWVPMGDVRAGDRVYGSDGKLHDVLSVHPQGVRPVYRLTFSDGSWARCDAGHLWTLRNHNGTWRTRSTDEWASLPLRKKSGAHHKFTLFAPLIAPVERKPVELAIEPYTLGLLLGDGHMSKNQVSFTTADEELWQSLDVGSDCIVPRSSTGQGAATTYGIVEGSRRRGWVRGQLKALELLGRDSYTKFIPSPYLRASIAQRLALLQGLLDTDGSVSGSSAEFTSASAALADGVQELVESLGGTCTRRIKIVKWHDGRELSYHRLFIILPRGLTPFRLRRKAAQYEAAPRQREVRRAVVSIERDGEEECSCITVSSPDRLYVTRHHLLTHNSHASAIVLAERVRKKKLVVYSTQEHAVAHETREKLKGHGVYDQSVHIHSPLVQVGDGPVCQRKDELTQRVFEYGQSLQGKICPTCEHKDNCAALKDAKARAAALPGASVVFTSHAGIRQVIGQEADGSAKGKEYELIVDEMPGVFEPVAVSSDDLAVLADPPMQFRAALMPRLEMAIRGMAQAILQGLPDGHMRTTAESASQGSAIGQLVETRALVLQRGVEPAPAVRRLIPVAAAFIKLVCHYADGGTVYGWDDPTVEGLSAMLPDACHTALINNRGVLLSATPLMAALPDFDLKDVGVVDGAPVRRVQVLTGGRGSHAMTRSYQQPDGTYKRRDPEPGEGPGIPWPVVYAALARAKAEADKHTHNQRVLFVSFKAVIDQLRPLVAGLDWLELGHFGALRGKNDWMEGRDKEVSVCYCLGAPRGDIEATLYTLGLVGEAATQAWRAYAAGELTQAEGRLRLPRRTKPCTVVVEGDVCPSSWTSAQLNEIIELDAP